MWCRIWNIQQLGRYIFWFSWGPLFFQCLQTFSTHVLKYCWDVFLICDFLSHACALCMFPCILILSHVFRLLLSHLNLYSRPIGPIYYRLRLEARKLQFSHMSFEWTGWLDWFTPRSYHHWFVISQPVSSWTWHIEAAESIVLEA